MALNNITFKTITDLWKDMIAELEARTGKIKTYNTGNVVSVFYQAIATQLGYLQVLLRTLVTFFFLSSAKGKFLTARAYDWLLDRKIATYASGVITVNRVNDSTVLTIPTGTIFTTDPNPTTFTQDYILLNDIVLDVGDNTGTGLIRATKIGTIGNTRQNTILYSKRPITGISSITNEEDISDGTDEETDSELVERVRLKMIGLNGARRQTIRSKVLEILGVDYCFIENNQLTSGVFYVYVNNKNGNLSNAILNEVNNVVSLEKAEGTNVAVMKTPVTLVSLYMKLKKINRLYDTQSLTDSIKIDIMRYINSLPPSSNLRISDLTSIIEGIKGVDYVVNENNSLQLKINNSFDDYESVYNYELIRVSDDLITIEFIDDLT